MARKEVYLVKDDPSTNVKKFWQGVVEGCVVQYWKGNVGKRGKPFSLPPFPSAVDAEAELFGLVSKLRIQGYREVTDGRPPAPNVNRPVNPYAISWRTAGDAQITGAALESAFASARAVLDDLRGRLGKPFLWCGIGVESGGHGGPVIHFENENGEKTLRFGFMPDYVFEGLTYVEKQQHELSGIWGWLAPNGTSKDGGQLQTDGLWVDLPVRVFLSCLMASLPSGALVLEDDLLFGAYQAGSMVRVIRDHPGQFIWSSHADVLRTVMAVHGMAETSNQLAWALSQAVPDDDDTVLIV